MCHWCSVIRSSFRRAFRAWHGCGLTDCFAVWVATNYPDTRYNVCFGASPCCLSIIANHPVNWSVMLIGETNSVANILTLF